MIVTLEELSEEFPETLVLPEYDDCIIGLVYRGGDDPLVVYDTEKVVQKLEKDGMDRDDAEEFFDFNIAGAWVGKNTPLFLERFEVGEVAE